MPEPTNNERAHWAAQVTRDFSRTPASCGNPMASPDAIEPEDVSDLLADLMHLCRHTGMAFDELFETARMNYDAEVAEESA
ncbi:MAG TPA: hypothetical protein VGL77_01615 [Armatimonadota bacterium]